MTILLKDFIASRPASERRLIKVHTAKLRAEMALEELRSARKITQSAVAKALKTSQGEVSRIEKRDDMHLSTLRGYVEGLGGKLELTAVFPEGESIPLVVNTGKSSNKARVERARRPRGVVPGPMTAAAKKAKAVVRA